MRSWPVEWYRMTRLGRVVGDPVIAHRVRQLGELLVQPTEAPAIVLAAVVHAEIATLGAFGAASGLVARGAEHQVLVASGLDPYGVVVVEAGHAADPAGYRAGLAGYADGGVQGVTGWILHCAAAVGRGAELSPEAAPRMRERRESRALGLDDEASRQRFSACEGRGSRG